MIEIDTFWYEFFWDLREFWDLELYIFEIDVFGKLTVEKCQVRILLY